MRIYQIKFMLIGVMVLLVGCSDGAPSGKYMSSSNNAEVIELRKDGSFIVLESGSIQLGKYEIKKNNIYLRFNDGGVISGKMEGHTLIDPDGVKWIKQ